MTESSIIIDRKREKQVQQRAGDNSLQTLGLTDKDGELTRHGLTVLTRKVDPIPAWLGFEVYSWPASIIDHHRAGGPLEKRRFETIDTIDILAGEAVATLGEHQGPAVSDLIRIVVTETLANAVTHRDYDIEEPIKVNQFPDAIAVWSPGLPVFSTLSRGMFEGRGTRNPELHFVLSALGYGQCQGLGWPRCTQIGNAAGLSTQANPLDGGVEVVVAVDPARRVALEAARNDGRSTRLRLPQGVWDERVREVLSDGEFWRPKTIEERIGIPRSTLNVVLTQMVERGEIERSHDAPRSPKQSWRLVPSTGFPRT